MRRFLSLSALLTGALLALAPTAHAARSVSPGCGPVPAGVQARAVSVTRLALPAALAGVVPDGDQLTDTAPFAGTVLSPSTPAPVTADRPLPAVVLLHGSGGTQCDLYPLAGALAARGYVALTLTQPDNKSGTSEASGVQALLSALSFLGGPQNPARDRTDPDDVGLVGHSEGAGVVSLAQGLPGFAAVRAVVALDNLRRWLTGDPGAALRSCARKPAYAVTPRVPALGLAMDAPCSAEGVRTGADDKETGWRWWRATGVPGAELVLAGFRHRDFADRGTPQQAAAVAALSGAWLDRWLRGDAAALTALSGCTDGGLLGARLSATFSSGVYLPALQLSTPDARRDLPGCS